MNLELLKMKFRYMETFFKKRLVKEMFFIFIKNYENIRDIKNHHKRN